jgi:tetratricopeptide (TPR) repeat protein
MSRCLGWMMQALLVMPLALAAGCAALSAPAAKTFANSKQLRSEEAHRIFDENRDNAEFQEASRQFSSGDIKGADESLTRLLQRNPKHHDGRLLMIDVCIAKHRPEDAQQHANKAAEAFPKDAHVQHAVALLLDAADRREEALAYYKRAAEWEPGNEAFTLSYQAALEGGGHAARADSTGKTSVTSDRTGETPAAPIAAAVPEAATVVTPAAAVSFLPSRSASSPVPPPGKPVLPETTRPADGNGSADSQAASEIAAILARGHAALKADDMPAALRCYREAAALGPDNPQILLSAAAGALRSNRPDVVVELLTPVEKQFSNSAALKRALGTAYYRLGNYRAAEVSLQQALSLDKSSALAYFLMGCTLAKLGQPAAADEHLRQAQLLDPRYTLRR